MGEFDAVLHTPWERSLGHKHILLSMVSNHTHVLSFTLSALMAAGPLQPISANDGCLHSSLAGACQVGSRWRRAGVF